MTPVPLAPESPPPSAATAAPTAAAAMSLPSPPFTASDLSSENSHTSTAAVAVHAAPAKAAHAPPSLEILKPSILTASAASVASSMLGGGTTTKLTASPEDAVAPPSTDPATGAPIRKSSLDTAPAVASPTVVAPVAASNGSVATSQSTLPGPPRRTRSRRGTTDTLPGVRVQSLARSQSGNATTVLSAGGHGAGPQHAAAAAHPAVGYHQPASGMHGPGHPASGSNSSNGGGGGGGGGATAPAPIRTSSVVRRHTVNGTDPMFQPGSGLASPAFPNSGMNSAAGSGSVTGSQLQSYSQQQAQMQQAQHPGALGSPGYYEAGGGGSSTMQMGAGGSPTSPTTSDLARRRTLSRNFGAKKIDKHHEKYAFMYHMLTGIRLSVSRCETKDDRDLLPDDFRAQHKLTSDITGAELESSQRYDFKFKDYCPMVFRKIRAAFGLTAPDYLNSLTGKYILSELFSPGKSKSYLYYSHDYRYIIKTIHPAEQKRLLKILPQYVDYVSKNPNTLLARYYGLHRVKMPKKDPVHFVVMANVFPPNYDIHLTFDLKGSTIGREISPEEMARKGKRAVLKDLNWLKMNRQLMLGPDKAKLFTDQLEKDMVFLMTKNIMDYSLLIGVHDLTKGNGAGAGDAAGGGPQPFQVFEPNRMTLQRNPSTPRADTMRKAIQQPEITRLDTISALQLPPAPDPAAAGRNRSVFLADHGGFRSTDAYNRPLNELYFMSVIDILTPYNTAKKVEHAFKAVTNPADRKQISAVKPADYGKRFVAFMKSLVGVPATPPPPGPYDGSQMQMQQQGPGPSALSGPPLAMGGGGGSGYGGSHVAQAPRTAPIGEEAEDGLGSTRSLNHGGAGASRA
ncbi:Phosphatidylinositol-4-phosphate 5-kinase [Blastocladiella emersonii ATCC 22665]|nr:Phosphatidylinositol-4-phosphate 5-kinase [Blastocladiella emersonii ATCC 22665]